MCIMYLWAYDLGFVVLAATGLAHVSSGQLDVSKREFPLFSPPNELSGLR